MSSWVDIKHTLWKMWVRLCGRKVCPKCGGWGIVERLDAHTMLRFGLRPWNGCANCGGHLEHRGAGYTPYWNRNGNHLSVSTSPK
jgi:hypothetical protein